VTTVCLLGLTAGAAQRRGADVELKIGIVQRFGEPTDHLKLQAGDHTQFQTGDAKRGWQQTLQPAVSTWSCDATYPHRQSKQVVLSTTEL